MDKEIAIIDRFEGDLAVIEYGRTMVNIPRKLLPGEAAEGDVLSIKIEIDREKTGERKRQIDELAKDLFKDE